MSRCRSRLRALADTGLGPHEVLRHADRMVAESGFERVGTCLPALGDPRTNTIAYANAGRLPPIRLIPEGRTEIAPIPAEPPLGTGVGSYDTITRPGLHGGTLIRYTDGLVERREEEIDESLDLLTRLRLAPRDPLDRIVDDVPARMTDGPGADDSAVPAGRARCA
jgi:serine phosphatase RsbU (regulator of sigma subunit)